MNSYDKRQFEKMQNLIVSFKKKIISLSSFVSSIEFLFHALEKVDDNWGNLFLEEIATLESVNSGIPSNVNEEIVKNLIVESIDNLDKLINEYLQKE